MRALGRHPWYVWMVWAATFSIAIACPMLVAEPTIVYLADPELLLLAMLIGSEHARVAADVRLLQLRALGARLRPGWAPRSARVAPGRSDRPEIRLPRMTSGPLRTAQREARRVDRTGPGRSGARPGNRHVPRLRHG